MIIERTNSFACSFAFAKLREKGLRKCALIIERTNSFAASFAKAKLDKKRLRIDEKLKML